MLHERNEPGKRTHSGGMPSPQLRDSGHQSTCDHWSWVFLILEEKTEVQTYVKLTDLQILPIKTFLKTLSTKQTLSVGAAQPAALQLGPVLGPKRDGLGQRVRWRTRCEQTPGDCKTEGSSFH